jgi:hypothetical protein
MKKMFSRACRVLFVLLLLTAAAPTAGAAQQGFRVELGEAQSPEAQHVRTFFEENRVFDRLVRGLNGWVRMPRPVALHAVECTTSDVRWVPEQASVEVCYGLLPRLTDVLAADSVAGALTPSFYYLVMHGAAHAVVDELNLPTPGGEEQAVDEVMALILVAQGGPMGSALLSGMQTLQRADAGWAEWEHAQAHQLTAERLDAIACIAFGANPSRFPEYRQRDLVPAGRTAACEAAYQRVASGLGQRLARQMN